jgi:mono/diheme cytochrome c family protein
MAVAALIALAQLAPAEMASAQGAFPGGASLNPQQHEGWLLTLQFCALCHTRTNLNSTATIGPMLSRESAGGRDDVLRQVIADGTPNMPGFKYQFEASQLEAIVAYLKTIPPEKQSPQKKQSP